MNSEKNNYSSYQVFTTLAIWKIPEGIATGNVRGGSARNPHFEFWWKSSAFLPFCARECALDPMSSIRHPCPRDWHGLPNMAERTKRRYLKQSKMFMMRAGNDAVEREQ
ncbi:unnamed protein product [Calypogeia fissa]